MSFELECEGGGIREYRNFTPIRVAAIDIGSNSIHLVIAETDNLSFRTKREILKDSSYTFGMTKHQNVSTFSIIHKERQLVRLGEGLGITKEYFLKEEAINRTIDQIKKYLIKIKELDVNKVFVATTSAVRSAKNGEEFLKLVKELGLPITVVSGKEEGELIYLGVKSDPYFTDKAVFIIDIGGGSAEFIVGKGEVPDIVQSLDLGAVRMTSMFLHTDPPTLQEQKKLNEYVKTAIWPVIKKIKIPLNPPFINGESVDGKNMEIRTPFDIMIGTSGAIFTLTDLLLRRNHEWFTDNKIDLNDLIHKNILLNHLKELTEYLYSIPLEKRLQIPHLHPRRADIIMAGASVLITIMEEIGIKEMITCERALREGLIARYLFTL